MKKEREKRAPALRRDPLYKSRKGAKHRRRVQTAKIATGTIFAAFFAILFLMPIILTITNSFMSASEIAANYGTVFATDANGGKVYISEKVNLKFIPPVQHGSFQEPGVSAEILEFRDTGGAHRGVPAAGGLLRLLRLCQI